MSVFPNPATSTLTVNCEFAKEITIYSTDGKLQIQQNVNRNTNELNISNLAKGTYLIKVATKDSYATRIFVKE